jgi:hypothetical protein
MKPLTLLTIPLLAIITYCVFSCGGEDSKDASTDATDTSTTTTTTGPAVSTISTTPENVMLATHKVKDFSKWVASYDANDSLRLANGMHSFIIGRSIKDSSMVLVVVKADDISKAKAFAKDPALKQAMQKGGVTGTPQFKFVTITFQDTSKIDAEMLSRTTFTVKDWDQWQRSFDSTRQIRRDNGIVDRAYGHDADNNKKVMVVVALTDTAKAFAHWKSDEIKKRIDASGVIGQPERFLFRVVKRY